MNSPRNFPVPTLQEVAQIAAQIDPILRNLQITQCYAELSQVLPQRTGSLANWCTFATWASKQAGQTIRKEDLIRTLERVLDSTPTAAQAAENLAFLAQHMGSRKSLGEIRAIILEALSLSTGIDRASKAVGRGNKMVFEEIGHESPASIQSVCRIP